MRRYTNADFPYLPYTYQSSNVWHASDHDPVIGTFVYPAGEYEVYLPVLFLT
ncbi:MAG: hypothetical protein KDE29_15990 [Anaerolineales bacterium]|nr:hypothetical protein [Anaerolineales bacterium]